MRSAAESWVADNPDINKWVAAESGKIAARTLAQERAETYLTGRDAEGAIAAGMRRRRIEAEVRKRFLSETSAYGLFDPDALLGVDAIEDDTDPEFFIDGILEKETLSMLVADSYVGKSYLALDWGLCIAAGIQWQGHEVTQGNVLYLMMEGAKTTKNRIGAWKAHNKVTSAQLAGNFQAYNKVLNAMDDNSIEKLADHVKASGIDLVIFDTLSRSIGGANENAQEDMGQFIAAISRVREANPSASVLVLHHTKKDQPNVARGSTVLFAAMDTVWCLGREDNLTPSRELENQKMKSGTLQPKQSMKFIDCAASAVLVKADKLDDDKVLLTLAEMQGGDSSVEVKRTDLQGELVDRGCFSSVGAAKNRVGELVRAGKIHYYAGTPTGRLSLVKLQEF